jgi:hypothetical protein
MNWFDVGIGFIIGGIVGVMGRAILQVMKTLKKPPTKGSAP